MRYFKSFALVTAFVTGLTAGSFPPFQQISAFAQETTEAPDATNAAIAKTNAYVEFLNRALRASDSLQRYASWVDMKKGPSGKEMSVYGLYPLYDVRSEIDAVQQSAKAEPKMPELDAAMLAYVDAYQQIAPVIDRASKYYEREDYKTDAMAGAKTFHQQIAALAPAYWQTRHDADAAFAREKQTLNAAALAAIEKADGRNAAWQVRNVMNLAETVANLLPNGDKPVVDMPAFKSALDGYADAVTTFDDFALAHPGAFVQFEGQPAPLLAKLRDFYAKLVKAKGDARKGAGRDLDSIVSDYNTMVSISEMAVKDF